MKTLKFLLLLVIASALWQPCKAQCITFSTWSNSSGSDTVYVYPYVLTSLQDSLTATITIDFGDGHSQNAGGNIMHVYTDSGYYEICMTYTGTECTGTYCDSVYVNSSSLCDDYLYIATTMPQEGQAAFSVPAMPSGATYNWNFGAGASPAYSTSSAPVVTYTPGNHYVSLTITYGTCTQVLSTNVNVVNVCNANWGVQIYGRDAKFYPNTNPFSGASYVWNFGDGDTSTNPYPIHKFSALGNQNVCLIVTGANCTDTVCYTIHLTAPDCVSSDSLFYTYNDGQGGVDFRSYQTNRIDPNVTYSWDFGDGTTAQDSASIWHGFTASGIYNVCLNYADEYCTISSCEEVIVNFCPHSTSIIQTITDPYKAKFSVGSAQSDWTYVWSFSNGTTSTDSAVELSFTAGGTYTSTVTVTSPDCGSPIVLTTQVYVPNEGFCHITMSYITSGNTVYINVDSTSPIPVISRLIDYGDGFTSSYQFAHTYAVADTYEVCVTYISTICTTTVCKQVIIVPQLAQLLVEGIVYKGANHICDGFVYLIREDNDSLTLDGGWYMFDTLDVCNGHYAFLVPEGATYKIKAGLSSGDPDYANYLPTYYGNELNWADGTTITVGTGSNYDINLISGSNPGGPGFIGGYVSEGAGLGVIGNNDHRALGDPIPNVQINLLTENDIAVAHTYTDANGIYAFNNLALGTYKVYAEAINKTPVAQLVALMANNPSQENVNVDINSNSAVTGINDIAEITVEGIFPNPVKDKVVIRFTAKQNADATVQLTDIMGRTLSSQVIAISNGNNEVAIDMQNHANGVYHLSVNNKDNSRVVKLIKVTE